MLPGRTPASSPASSHAHRRKDSLRCEREEPPWACSLGLSTVASGLGGDGIRVATVFPPPSNARSTWPLSSSKLELALVPRPSGLAHATHSSCLGTCLHVSSLWRQQPALRPRCSAFPSPFSGLGPSLSFLGIWSQEEGNSRASLHRPCCGAWSPLAAGVDGASASDPRRDFLDTPSFLTPGSS